MKTLLRIISALTALALGHAACAYEVTTHQELTRRAIAGDNRAENLKFFLRTFDLEDVDYSGTGEITLFWIESATNTITATGSYIDVAERLTNDPAVNLGIRLPENFQGVIEAGSVLEDAALGTAGLDITHGRFNRHFYDVHRPGCYGLGGIATCSRNWGFNGGGANDPNLFTWVRAHNYYLDSILGPREEDRRLAQADLFLTVGHLAHLIEDLAQPSHSRDDSHPGGGAGHLAGGPTALEPWASDQFNTVENNIAGLDARIASAPDFHPTSFQNLFDDTATFVHNNFLSDDTIPGQLDDGDHGSPTVANLVETQIGNTNFHYMRSRNLTIPPNTRLGIHTVKSFWFDDYDLTAAINGNTDENVLFDNVLLLFPAAISRAEGLTNYLFRARIIATPDEEGDGALVVKNITSQSEISGEIDPTIRAGSTIRIAYDTVDGTRRELMSSIVLSEDLPDNTEVRVSGFQDAINQMSDPSLSDDQRIGEEKTITVVVDGIMDGNDPGENWVVAGTTFNFIANASVLLSFDRSGSMGAKLNDAKYSALKVVPVLVSGEENYAAIHSFSSSTRIDQQFTDDFMLVREAIEDLRSTGSTALYDAILLAGSQAALEKMDHSQNKSIIILYTDGIENVSDSTREEAIEAISTESHPEIDVVYLVFLGSDADGANILSDIAVQSGRRFLHLQNADQLASELVNIIK